MVICAVQTWRLARSIRRGRVLSVRYSMFHDIPDSIQPETQELEQQDTVDRTDGTPRLHRLRQIPQETGRFIALLAASAPAGASIEIGTERGLFGTVACTGLPRARTDLDDF